MTLQLLIIEGKNKYTNYFKNNSDYDVSQQDNTKLLSMDNSDIAIIDGDTVNIEEVIQKKEYFDKYQYVLFIGGEISKEDQVLLKMNEFIPIDTKEPQHVLSALENIISNQKNDRVFSFIGSDRKAGNTSIIHAVAETLADVSTKSVLVVSVNNNLSEPLYSDVTLDILKTSIMSKTITFDEILNLSKFNGKYSYIGASDNIFDFSKYSPKEIEGLYSVCLNQDSHLVLLDLGSDVQNPFLPLAFDYIQHIFLVTRPQFNYQYSFSKKVEQIFNQYYRRTQKNFYTILNAVDGATDLKANYKIITKVSYSEFGYEAENASVPLHKLDTNFANEISDISKFIANLNGSYINNEETNKSSLFKWFKKIKNANNPAVKPKGGLNDGV